MLTIYRTRGVAGPPELIAPIRRAELGGYESAAPGFADMPAVTCEVWPGGGLPVAATLPAAWLEATEDDPNPGVLSIDFPESVTSALTTGRWQVRARLADGGQEIARLELVMVPGAGSAEPRPAYHAYDDLLREWPTIEKLADDLHDQTGFAATAAEARDWIDAKVVDAARRGCGLPSRTACYVDALADERLTLDTPEGRKVVRASVYRTLAVLLRRIDGMTSAPGEYDDKRKEYQAWADAELEGLWVAFAPEAGLRPLRIGGMRVGRVTR